MYFFIGMLFFMAFICLSYWAGENGKDNLRLFFTFLAGASVVVGLGIENELKFAEPQCECQEVVPK